jgi:hypothetical protein
MRLNDVLDDYPELLFLMVSIGLTIMFPVTLIIPGIPGAVVAGIALSAVTCFIIFLVWGLCDKDEYDPGFYSKFIRYIKEKRLQRARFKRNGSNRR